MNEEKKVEGSLSTEKKILLTPLVLIVAVIPLIVYLYVYAPNLSQYVWFADEMVDYNYFLAVKQFMLIGIGLIMLSILLINKFRWKRKLKWSSGFIPLGVYLVFVLLSSITAENKQFAFLGGFEQFQSCLAIFTYGLTIVYAMTFIENEQEIKYVIKGLLIGAIVVTFIGVMQFLGFDLFGTKFGMKLITPRSMRNVIESITIKDLGSKVYCTLLNPNYVGSYVALLLPFVSVLFYYSKKRVRYLPIIILLMICLVGSDSETGILAIVIDFVIIAAFMYKELIRKWYITLAGILVIAIVLVLPVTRSKINDIMARFTQEKSQYNLEEIKTLDDCVVINYKGNQFSIDQIVDGENLYGYDILDCTDGSTIATQYNEENYTYTILDERFYGIQICPIIARDVFCMEVLIDNTSWIFTDQLGDDTYYLYNSSCKFDKVAVAKSIGFDGYEKFASGRGYLWSRTLPLLVESILLGCGPDNFIYPFPSNDYVMLNNVGFYNSYITKPHSMYLQMGVETGVVSLIMFLALIIWYIATSIKYLFFRRQDSSLNKYGIGIMFGVIGYMIAGLGNDSMICVAPVFWGLLGIGMTINAMLKMKLSKS